MSLKRKIIDIHQSFQRLEERQKKDLLLLGVVMLLLFFSYPLIRSTTTSLLLSKHGAEASPYAWIYSVFCLSVIVTIFNKFQKKMRPQQLYSYSIIVTCSLFLVFLFLLHAHSSYWSYALYVWKEVYIVLMVHSVLGYLNASVPEETAKIVYGPIGAIGSLGGITGAFLTSSLVRTVGEEKLFLFGVFLVGLTLFFFRRTSNESVHLKEAPSQSPLESVKGCFPYVALIALIVLLSQFVINIGNYKFNYFLNQEFVSSVDKTEFLGKVYGWINTISLVIQLMIIPLVFRYVRHFYTHLSIPLLFGLSFYGGLFLSGATLMPVAITFIVFKGVDYSIFGAAKELLYFSLTDIQKYGAKYIADMIMYRLAKGIISVILIKIPYGLINTLMGLSLGAWILCLFPLFRLYRQYHKNREVL